MDTITVIFTKDYYNILSWLIRWTLPRSRFALALSSHCLIDIGDGLLYQDIGLSGVFTTNMAKIKETDTIVAIKKYPINNKEAAITFLKSQLGKKYDYLGALGLALAPSRKWDEDDSWFCYELAANAISAGGGEQFSNLNHITETALLAIQSTDVTP